MSSPHAQLYNDLAELRANLKKKRAALDNLYDLPTIPQPTPARRSFAAHPAWAEGCLTGLLVGFVVGAAVMVLVLQIAGKL